MDKWRTFMNLRDDVNRALETARNEKVIGKSLEAKVTIASNDKFNASEFLTSFDALHQLFIVSQVKVVDKLDDQATAYEHGDIVIEHADGEKCERCWNYSEDTWCC
ncbi:zinc finger domain-containing protein [Staphylococcus aureus]|nr:zinc finger domain-containing protein [Staphylococcus aureus]